MVSISALLFYICSCTALSVFFKGSSRLHQISEISFLFPDIQSSSESIYFVDCSRDHFFSFLKAICTSKLDACENGELRAILTHSNLRAIVEFLEHVSNLPMSQCALDLEAFWLEQVRRADVISALDLSHFGISSCELLFPDPLIRGIPTIEMNLQDLYSSTDQTPLRPIVHFKGERSFAQVHSALKELPYSNSSLSPFAYAHYKGTMKFLMLESVSNYMTLSQLEERNEVFYLQLSNLQELKSIIVHAAQYAGSIGAPSQLQDLVFFDPLKNWFKIAFPFLVGTSLVKEPAVLYAALEQQLLHLEHRHKQIVAQEYPLNTSSFDISVDINDLVVSFFRRQEQLNWIQNYSPLFHQDLTVLSSDVKEEMISSLQQLLQ